MEIRRYIESDHDEVWNLHFHFHIPKWFYDLVAVTVIQRSHPTLIGALSFG